MEIIGSEKLRLHPSLIVGATTELASNQPRCCTCYSDRDVRTAVK